jgi:hypothetical protein
MMRGGDRRRVCVSKGTIQVRGLEMNPTMASRTVFLMRTVTHHILTIQRRKAVLRIFTRRLKSAIADLVRDQTEV